MRLLDLFCGEGGAATGYRQAGFYVTGIDLVGKHARRYVGQEFIRTDAVEYLKAHGHEYDVIHASPPCQAYSIATIGSGYHTRHPRLIHTVRDALVATGKPYIIENVVGAPLIRPVLLCGSMFNLTATDRDGTVLRLERHRLFESNLPLSAPGPCRHDKTIPVGGVYGGGRMDRTEAKTIRRGGYTPVTSVRGELIGSKRMSMRGLSQSIPPAYTKWLGEQVLALLPNPGPGPA